jgi:hypothetical protein
MADEKKKPAAKLVAVDKQSKAKAPLLAVWNNGDGRLSFSLEKGVRIVTADGVDVTLGRDGAHYGNVYVNEPLAVTGNFGGGPGPSVSAPADSFADDIGDDKIPFLVDEGSRDGAR